MTCLSPGRTSPLLLRQTCGPGSQMRRFGQHDPLRKNSSLLCSRASGTPGFEPLPSNNIFYVASQRWGVKVYLGAQGSTSQGSLIDLGPGETRFLLLEGNIGGQKHGWRGRS